MPLFVRLIDDLNPPNATPNALFNSVSCGKIISKQLTVQFLEVN